MRLALFSAAILLALGACQSSNTAGPYPASVGRTDCHFSDRVSNWGFCPSIPTPVIEVAKAPPSDKGCGFVDYFSNEFSCPAPLIAPGEDDIGAAPSEVHCYRSLGYGADCYSTAGADRLRKPSGDAGRDP